MKVKLYTDCGIWYIDDVSDFVDLVTEGNCDTVILVEIARDLESKFHYPFTKVLYELLENKHENAN